jgi:hypothetical protein
MQELNLSPAAHSRLMRTLGLAYGGGAVAGLAMIGVLVVINSGQSLDAVHYAIFTVAAVAFILSLVIQIRITRQIKRNRR